MGHVLSGAMINRLSFFVCLVSCNQLTSTLVLDDRESNSGGRRVGGIIKDDSDNGLPSNFNSGLETHHKSPDSETTRLNRANYETAVKVPPLAVKSASTHQVRPLASSGIETEPIIAFDYGFYYYGGEEPKQNSDICPATCVAPSPEHAAGTPETCDTWVRSAV